MLELLNNLPFVKVEQEQGTKEATQKRDLKAGLQESILELKEVLAGRKEARSIYDFLNELETEDGV